MRPCSEAAPPARRNEAGRVRDWREECASRLGYGEREADEIAADATVDLHLLEGLIEWGCPLELARRIV